MATLLKEFLVVRSIEKLSIAQIYPEIIDEVNLNTCHDPDCGNYGVALDGILSAYKGRDAAERRLIDSVSIPSLSTGLGRYKINKKGLKELKRISDTLEYENDPVFWTDGRKFQCQHSKNNSECGLSFKVLSNQHLAEEVARLSSQNGLLDGPSCGHCGQLYLDTPGEFIFNGKAGRNRQAKSTVKNGIRKRKARKPSVGIRLIHKPCRGKPGARFTVSSDHNRQVDRGDNLRILTAIVNEVGVNDLRRMLIPSPGNRKVGIGRIYDRIFWLERVLVAYERAQMKKWKEEEEKRKPYRHMRIAHDDIALSVNWETRFDRRTTVLNCSVSADIRSGYVFRVDVDFDPTIDPVSYIQSNYLSEDGEEPALRKRYKKADGTTFTAPLLSFQRPSGRYDESALFASAEAQLRVFVAKTEEAFERTGVVADIHAERALNEARRKADEISNLRNRCFNFPFSELDNRNSFNGIMTSDIYTKAAHLTCLKELMPNGKMTLVGEKEGILSRVLPHIFRDEILDDRFEWLVLSFNKEATTTQIDAKVSAYKKAIKEFQKRTHRCLAGS